jgi:hypothetical protein
VDVKLAREADDRQRPRPVRRNPAASLFMNRLLTQIAPALDERATGLLKNQLGPGGPMPIVYPAVATPFANGLVDAKAPQPCVDLHVNFQQEAA